MTKFDIFLILFGVSGWIMAAITTHTFDKKLKSLKEQPK